MRRFNRPRRGINFLPAEKPLSEAALWRRLITLLAVLVIFLAGLFFGGIFLLSNLTTFWDIFSPPSPTPPPALDAIAPPPPFLQPLPSTTNRSRIDVQGLAEPGSTVEIWVSERSGGSVLVDKQGGFEIREVLLSEGISTISARVKDQAGNESAPSRTYTVVFDKVPPKLEITRPGRETTFTDPVLEVGGLTEAAATVFVNEHQAIVGSDGTFSYHLTLTEGETLIKIEAKDAAGNTTTVEKTVNYAPLSEEKD